MTHPLCLLLALLACRSDFPAGVGTLEVHPGPEGAFGLFIQAALARTDASPDLVLMEHWSPRAEPRLFLWRSSQPDEPMVPLDLDFDYRAPMWARDVDGDGYDELVMATTEGMVALTGPVAEAAAWEPVQRRDTPSHYVDDVEVLDLDGDGHLDWLLGLGMEEWSAMAVYRGPVDPAVEVDTTPEVLLPAPVDGDYTTALAFPGDLTGDGVDDLFLGPKVLGPAWLYPGPLALDGTDEPVIVFEAVAEYTDQGWVGISAWTLDDLSGDGELDLVAAEGQNVYAGDLRFGGHLSVWYGPLADPLDLHTPDARLVSPDIREQWTPVVLVDLDGDGISDPVLHSGEVGEVVYDGCDQEFLGGALAWHPGGFVGEVLLEDEDILFAATKETGRMGAGYSLGDLDGDGREELAVSLPELGVTWLCDTSNGGQAVGPSEDTTGGFGILELP